MKTKKTNIVDESSIVDALKEKYKERLARAEQELKADEKRMKSQGSYISDLLMFWKWAYRVGRGYGFNLGHIPPVWTDMLDEFLQWVESQCPNFEINQIKMKLGMIRIYIDTHSDDEAVNESIRAEIRKMMNLMRTSQIVRSAHDTERVQKAARKKRQNRLRKP